MTTYSCPGCNHEGDLSKYVCLNCNKYGAMEVTDGNYPFHCENCDLSWETLSCPKCSTRITKKFINEGGSVFIIIIILVVLFFIFKK